MPPKRITVTDIAKAVQVTAGTVSRALAGDIRVKADTRARIMRAARELGYAPNAGARSLRRGRNNLIGVFCEAGDWIFFNPYFGQLIAGVTQEAEADANHLVFYLPRIQRDPNNKPAAWDVHLTGLEELRDGRVDGGFVLGSDFPDRKELEEFKKVGLPLVLLGADERVAGVSQLLSGVEERYRLMLEAVVAKGHRRIGVIGLLEGSAHNRAALAEIRKFYLENKLPFERELFQEAGGRDVQDIEEVQRLFRNLFERKITALICAVPLQAWVVRNACQEMNIQLPGDLSLVSTGPMVPPMKETRPKLTLLEADLREAGREAYRLFKRVSKTAKVETQSIRWKWGNRGETLSQPPKSRK